MMTHYFGSVLLPYHPCFNLSSFLQDFTFSHFTCLKNRQKVPIRKHCLEQTVNKSHQKGITKLLHSAHAVVFNKSLSTSPLITTAEQRGSALLVMTSQPAATTVVAAEARLLSGCPTDWRRTNETIYWDCGVSAACGCWGDADMIMGLTCTTAQRPCGVRCGVGSKWEWRWYFS